MGLHNCTGMGANLNLLKTEMVFVKKGGILCDILWDGLGRVCPRFWEMGVLDIRRTLWLYFLLESFLYPSKASRGSWHSVTACRRPVTLASHIKELWLKIWDRWGSIRISDIYFAPERCIWCCSSLRWCFFFSLTWTQRSKPLRLWFHNATYRLTRLSFYYLSNIFYCLMWNPP